MAEETFADSSGRILKMEVDYSETVTEKIPICESLAAAGKLNEALEILLGLEKQARTGADTHSTGRILVAIVQICFKVKDYKALMENITFLAKRRSQIKQAVTKMIQECCSFVDQMPDKKTLLEYIDVLRQVTDGKIYVEVERARLTYKLSKMKEAEGNISEAATIMQELQVETFGSMDKREKVELLLEQMRLCLAKKDPVRTQIISKKINTKYFEDETVEDLKLKYYELMITLDQHDGSYIKIAKHFMSILESKSIKEDPAKRKVILMNMVIYCILSEYDNESSDMMSRIYGNKLIDEVPEYKKILSLFIDAELVNWAFMVKTYEPLLRVGNPSYPVTTALTHDEDGNKRWDTLKERIVQHNIRIISKYYSRVSLVRLASLLDLTIEEAESKLSQMVTKKTIWAKIDRLDNVVSFDCYKEPNDVLNDWSFDINKLMENIAKVNHLINKEEMLHLSMVGNA